MKHGKNKTEPEIRLIQNHRFALSSNSQTKQKQNKTQVICIVHDVSEIKHKNYSGKAQLFLIPTPDKRASLERVLMKKYNEQ